MEQCPCMKRYDNELLRGVYVQKALLPWSCDGLVDPDKATQFYASYKPKMGNPRHLTHPNLVEEHYLHCPEGAEGPLKNRAGYDNDRVAEFSYALRILFLFEIGMDWRSRRGRGGGTVVVQPSLDVYRDKLREEGVDFESIIAGWIQQERDAGLLYSAEESQAMRLRNPEADLRRSVAVDGRDVPPDLGKAAEEGSERRHGALASRLDALEASNRALATKQDALATKQDVLQANLDNVAAMIVELADGQGKLLARQALFAENEIKVVQLLTNLKGQLDEMDNDLQDVVEGAYSPVVPAAQPVQMQQASPAAKSIGLVGAPGPQHLAEPQAKAQHAPVPGFKPDVQVHGDFGDAMAFSDMMNGK
jgi:hypothetical protein